MSQETHSLADILAATDKFTAPGQAIFPINASVSDAQLDDLATWAQQISPYPVEFCFDATKQIVIMTVFDIQKS